MLSEPRLDLSGTAIIPFRSHEAIAMCKRLALVFALLILSSGSGCPVCDCYVPPGITIHLVEAVSGQPVEASIAAFAGTKAAVSDLKASCIGYIPPDSQLTSGPCSTWQFYLYESVTLFINVPGFQPTQVSTNAEFKKSVSCCPEVVNAANETIRLVKQ